MDHGPDRSHGRRPTEDSKPEARPMSTRIDGHEREGRPGVFFAATVTGAAATVVRSDGRFPAAPMQASPSRFATKTASPAAAMPSRTASLASASHADARKLCGSTGSSCRCAAARLVGNRVDDAIRCLVLTQHVFGKPAFQRFCSAAAVPIHRTDIRAVCAVSATICGAIPE